MKACAPVSVHSSQDVVRLPNKVAVVFPTGSLYVLLHLSLCLQGFDAFSVLIMITFIIIIIIIIEIYLFIKNITSNVVVNSRATQEMQGSVRALYSNPK